MNVVLVVVVCTVAAGLFQAQAQVQNAVCLSENRCIGTDLGVMSTQDCCVQNPNGASFRIPGQELCTECTVFGFFQESLTEVEQAENYVVQVGYLKAPSGTRSFTLNVRAADGTARRGSDLDYTLNTTQVTFNAPNSPVNVEFTLNQDGVLLEPNETFTLQLIPTAGIDPEFFFLDTLSVTIIDSDALTLNVSFEMEAYLVGENDGSIEVCLTTNIGHAEAFIAVIEVIMKGVDNPAAGNTDFRSGDQSVSFAPSDSGNVSCAQIIIIDDTFFEGNEQFLVRLQSFSNNQVMRGEISEACVTIVDDDVVAVNLTSASIDVDENNPNSSVCIALDGALGRNVNATVEIGPKAGASDPATVGSDYNSAFLTVTFEPMDDQISQEMCILLPIIDDLIANEANEQFSVALVDLTPMAVIDNNETCVTIIDNDVPEFSISPENIRVNESNTEVEVCIILIGSLGRNVVVTAETGPKVGASNQATADSDYATVTIQATFTPSDVAPQIMCNNVQIIDDELANEPDEQFLVSLTNADPIGVFGLNETCITIIDNDVPVFSLTPVAITVTEGNVTEVEVCINISGSIDRNVVVTAETGPKAGASSQATAGSDYQSTTITVTFEPSDESTEAKCGTVAIIDDMVAGEPNEQFSVSLVSADPTGTFGNRETCVTIVDDDNELVCHENADRIVDSSGRLTCECRKGFTGDGITDCTDIDECSNDTDVCSVNATCTNTVGSFECVCLPGFTGDGITCTDIDECSLGIDNCDNNAVCINTVGSFECVCLPGFTGDGVTCTDIDECLLGIDNCDSNAICVNTRGSFVCTCLPGYTGDGVTCTDIDECSLGVDNCDSNAVCTNTVGSFECVCLPGYTGDGITCTDIDECSLGLDNCDGSAVCVNTVGSFECVCLPGYTGDGITCTDIEECSLGTDNCDSNAICVNTVGSFECVCLPGFTGDGVTCTDIDECSLGVDNCDSNAVCTNTVGSFECVCLPGYTGDGVTCTDIDECTLGLDNCSNSAVCINTVGSFECVCLPGYTGDGSTCTDIDECSLGIDNCNINAVCINTEGSFECVCLLGFTGDGVTCTDIDECSLGIDNCDSNAVCINTVGSFECTCLPGFTGDGIQCTDIDECSTRANSCSDTALCANTEGSFECSCDCGANAICTNVEGSFVCTCRQGYTGDGFNCSDINECSLGIDNCSSNAVCTNTMGSFECTCLQGYTGDGLNCEDIDECETVENVCDKFVSCINVEGNYTCNCKEDGVECITRDVPVEDTPTKTKSKTKTPKSHGRRPKPKRSVGSRSSRSRTCTRKRRSRGECGCGKGYLPDSCEDINECRTGENDCSKYVKCVNSPGSFSCVCSCIMMDDENTTEDTTTKTTRMKTTTEDTTKRSKKTTKGTSKSRNTPRRSRHNN